MPEINFKSKTLKTIHKSSSPVEDGTINVGSTSDIAYDYDVVSTNVFDRNKSYYSIAFKSLILITDYMAKSYNFLTRYEPNEDVVHHFVCLYKDKRETAIPVTRDYCGGYKIYCQKLFSDMTKDTNINVELVEKRTNPDCVIYRIK